MATNNIKGLDKLTKKLHALGGNVEETLFKSMQRQCELVKAEAKILCPVDTGDLRQSISRKTKRAKGKVIGIVYTNSKYAAYVEFGTGQKGQRTNTNTDVALSYKQDKWRVNIPGVGVRWTDGQPAQPYLYPALKNNNARILENIRNDLKKAIQEVARR